VGWDGGIWKDVRSLTVDIETGVVDVRFVSSRPSATVILPLSGGHALDDDIQRWCIARRFPFVAHGMKLLRGHAMHNTEEKELGEANQGNENLLPS
jgi:hypothetical protein